MDTNNLADKIPDLILQGVHKAEMVRLMLLQLLVSDAQKA
jgi:hypothetical protein